MIYLDSCVLIYLVETESPSHRSTVELMAASGSSAFAISPLVVMECLVRPVREQDDGRRRDYESSFAAFAMVPMTVATYRRAAELRATHHLKTPDALHLAAALESGCSEIWTNDDRLSRAAGELARVVGR